MDNDILNKYMKKREMEAEVERVKQQQIMMMKMKRKIIYSINHLVKDTDYNLDLYQHVIQFFSIKIQDEAVPLKFIFKHQLNRKINGQVYLSFKNNFPNKYSFMFQFFIGNFTFQLDPVKKQFNEKELYFSIISSDKDFSGVLRIEFGEKKIQIENRNYKGQQFYFNVRKYIMKETDQSYRNIQSQDRSTIIQDTLKKKQKEKFMKLWEKNSLKENIENVSKSNKQSASNQISLIRKLKDQRTQSVNKRKFQINKMYEIKNQQSIQEKNKKTETFNQDKVIFDSFYRYKFIGYFFKFNQQMLWSQVVSVIQIVEKVKTIKQLILRKRALNKFLRLEMRRFVVLFRKFTKSKGTSIGNRLVLFKQQQMQLQLYWNMKYRHSRMKAKQMVIEYLRQRQNIHRLNRCFVDTLGKIQIIYRRMIILLRKKQNYKKYYINQIMDKFYDTYQKEKQESKQKDLLGMQRSSMRKSTFNSKKETMEKLKMMNKVELTRISFFYDQYHKELKTNYLKNMDMYIKNLRVLIEEKEKVNQKEVDKKQEQIEKMKQNCPRLYKVMKVQEIEKQIKKYLVEKNMI